MAGQRNRIGQVAAQAQATNPAPQTPFRWFGQPSALEQLVATHERQQAALQRGDYRGALNAALESPLAGSIGPADLAGVFGAMIKTYHGTPHMFKAEPGHPLGRFSSAHIGSGEGAQAYGHGLYFAENPKVAGTYRDAGIPTYQGRSVAEVATAALEAAKPLAADAKQAKNFAIRDLMDKAQAATDSRQRQLFYDAINNFDDVTGRKPGALYNVHIDVNHSDLLDWDKPLSQQSQKVKKALEKGGLLLSDPSATGESLYLMLEDKWVARSGVSSGLARASEELQSLGIPGIRYLDAGSRGASEGTRNIVMFPGTEHLITIKEKK